MTRNQVAKDEQISEAWLRSAEANGLLPVWGSCPPEAYRFRARLIRIARRSGLGTSAVRAALLLEPKAAAHD